MAAERNHITAEERDALTALVTAEYSEAEALGDILPVLTGQVPKTMVYLNTQRMELRERILEYVQYRREAWTVAQATHLRRYGETLFPYRSFWPWLEDQEQQLRDAGRVAEADDLAAYIDRLMEGG